MNPGTSGTVVAMPAHPRERVRSDNEGAGLHHHGIWAPGVRLFRCMGFGQKALCISFAFLVPIALLTWSYMRVQASQLADTAQEQRGVQYEREVLATLRLALVQQHLAGPAAGGTASARAETRDRMQEQLRKLEEIERSLGAELGTAAAHRAVTEAAAQLAQPSDSARGAQVAQGRFIDALLALASLVADSSGLSLDPELASYYLIVASVIEGPDLLTQLSRLRSMGSEALAAAAITPAQARQLQGAQPLASLRLGDIKAALAKVASADAGLISAKEQAAAFAAVDDFMSQVDSAVLGAEGPRGDPAAFALSGAKALAVSGELVAQALEAANTLLQARSLKVHSQRNLILGALALSLLMAGYLFRSFFKVLDGGLKEVERHLNAISEGDLTTHPEPSGTDEPAHLMLTLQALQGSLREIVSKVRASAESVGSSSSEVSAGSSDLSGRTENAASSLEETAAAMEELGSTVRQTADSAINAAALATSNAQAAERGGLIITQVMTTMQAINASSSKIGEIIGTIDGIAFQTNILALNAAVEAARAGSQGRGFAVVAAEVRALAQRSAAAAREIKMLIQDSVEKVGDGAKVVQGAGQTMRELVDSARQMKSIVGEISTATSEQSKGIAQVGQAVQQLDEMTQQNAALVEQTSAASSTLARQASTLIEEVGRFKLPDASRRPGR